MTLSDIIMLENIKKTLDTITNAIHLQKKLPDLYGVCNCNYEGNFPYKDTQYKADGSFAFALYDCPKCQTTISANTIITNLYKNK